MPRFDRRELLAIFVGGALGALVRAGLVEMNPDSAPGWPWTIFVVNVSGTFLLGYMATRLQERLPLSSYRRPFVGTGFCGALTTFSTMQLELLSMLDAHRYVLALGYASASIGGGFFALGLASALVRRVRTLR